MYYGSDFFNSFPSVPELRDIGMIFMGNYSGRERFDIVEHECLHSCLDKHASGLSALTDLHCSSDLDFHQLAYILEARIMNELIAYQDSFGDFLDAWSINRTLKGKYVDRQIKRIKEMFDEDITLPARLRHYMRDRISKDMKHMATIVKALPRRVRTPLLFGMGPTKEEMEKENLKSAIDDIVIWSYLVQEPEYMQKAKTILKAKGYSIE